MFLKLFIAMGLTWILELIAWLISKFGQDGTISLPLIIILNIATVLQGVVVFFVFVFKKSTRQSIKDKFDGSSSGKGKASRDFESSNSVSGAKRRPHSYMKRTKSGFGEIRESIMLDWKPSTPSTDVTFFQQS